MAKAETITLIDPVVWFDETVTKLVLKAPTGLLYMKHGEPRFAVMAADGAQYWIEKDDVVSAYIGALLTRDGETRFDGGDHIFSAMGLADIIQIKDTLFGFFTDARLAISARNSTSSSSTQEPSPPPTAGL